MVFGRKMKAGRVEKDQNKSWIGCRYNTRVDIDWIEVVSLRKTIFLGLLRWWAVIWWR
jgi:hypothetical protein